MTHRPLIYPPSQRTVSLSHFFGDEVFLMVISENCHKDYLTEMAHFISPEATGVCRDCRVGYDFKRLEIDFECDAFGMIGFMLLRTSRR